MSPVCRVPDEIVTVAPVRSASKDDTVRPESTATAAPPTVKVLVVPETVTTGAAIATLTLSAADVLVSALSSATTEIARAVLFVLVVENVTDVDIPVLISSRLGLARRWCPCASPSI